MNTAKKLLFALLLIPLLTFSQNKPEGWLTPYANVEFRDSLIIYYISSAEAINNPRLRPLCIDKNLLCLVTTPIHANVASGYIFESMNAIKDYLSTEPVSLGSSVEQEEYLRLAAMFVIWERKLSPIAVAEINRLTLLKDISVQHHAKLVIQLLDFYKNVKI